MTTALRPIGALCPAAPDGTLPRVGRAPVGVWAEIAAELSEAVAGHLSGPCRSAILRGSTARETAVLGASDIDMLFIVDDDLKVDHDLRSSIQPNLKIEATELGHQRLMRGDDCKWLRFNLAHAGWVFQGEGVLADLPPARLDKYAAAHLPHYLTWIADLDQHLAESTGPAEDKDICQWIMKRIVRSLFESVMLALNAYSRDIYPCAKAAADAYPAQAAAIWQAAEWAVAPSDDVQSWKPLVRTLTPVLEAAHTRFSLD